jgi:selenocysteine lyase/cysteine desulfurase
MSASGVTSGPSGLRDRVVGLDRPVPLLDGTRKSYVSLDNAATTPPLKDVADAVAEFLPFYSSVHRGSGFKSRLSTLVYDQAHEIIARFVGADPDTNTVIFGKNTTEAINKLSYRLPLSDDSVTIRTTCRGETAQGSCMSVQRPTDGSTRRTSTGNSSVTGDVWPW